jgi:hypothetical protein
MLTPEPTGVAAPASESHGARKLRELLRKRMRQLWRFARVLLICIALAIAALAV